VFYLLAALTLYGLGVFRAILRQQAARLFRPDLDETLRRVRRVERFAGPVVALLGLAGLVCSIFTRRVTWRGNTYEIGREGQIQLIESPASGRESLPPPHFDQAIHGKSRR
jgi:hypothetical protein